MRTTASRSLAFAFVLTTATLGGAPSGFAWGHRGHEVVNAAAVALMTGPGAAFFQTNAAALTTLANTPDTLWKQTNYDQEGSLHFFQWDRYRDCPLAQNFDSYALSTVLQRLGSAYVKTNGGAVWRIAGLYKSLVQALHGHNWVRSLQLAGVLGHYVGDLSQPMHVTSDYDGQSIGRAGIHSYYETTLVNKVGQEVLVADAEDHGRSARQALDQIDRAGAAVPFVRKLAVSEGIASLDQLPALLADFQADPQDDDALRASFGDRMGAGAANLSRIWDLAFEDAGDDVPAPSAVLDVSEPAFVPLSEESSSGQY